DMFEAMMQRFQEDTVRYLYLMQILERPPQPPPQDPSRNRRWRLIATVMETAGVRGWSQLPPTSWKKPLCAASAANWNKPEWQVAARRNKSSRWCVARKKS